jgi:hypothetical protein
MWMPQLILIALQLYGAHLIADFVLQPRWIADGKRDYRRLAIHAAIHFACGCAFVNVGLNRTFVLGILGLAIAHAVIDFVKAVSKANGWIAFVIDQTIHLVSVIVAATWLAGIESHAVRSVVVAWLVNPRLYLYIAAYTGVVLGGGYLVQKVTQSFLNAIDDTIKAVKPGLPNAGQYIGWIERGLVLTFVLTGFNDAVGFLLAVKALTRYPEIKEDTKGHFAEYFLIGTLTSVGLALGGGLTVRGVISWLDNGT